MDIELCRKMQGSKLQLWQNLLQNTGLQPDDQWERTVLIWEDGELIAAGSRQGNLLKCIAVDETRQGEGLTATLLTQLRQDAFDAGYRHLFLYTKPKNRFMFESLFFYPIAETENVLLMEDKPNGIQAFMETLPALPGGSKIGAAVMNCNPFTRGHRYLIETAAAECDRLYVFVLSEDKSEFTFADRMEMVRLGTADLPNVSVLPTGPYLISSATFPTYFLKDRDSAQQVHCLLDIEIFCRYFAPKFGITHRFVGTEPLSAMTRQYNETLQTYLPAKGIELRQIARLEHGGAPISASLVRSLLAQEEIAVLADLLPETTLTYLTKK